MKTILSRKKYFLGKSRIFSNPNLVFLIYFSYIILFYLFICIYFTYTVHTPLRTPLLRPPISRQFFSLNIFGKMMCGSLKIFVFFYFILFFVIKILLKSLVLEEYIPPCILEKQKVDSVAKTSISIKSDEVYTTKNYKFYLLSNKLFFVIFKI